MWNFEISLKSKIKLLPINIPSDVSDKHFSNDIKEWPLQSILSFCFYDKYPFVVCFNKFSFFHLNYQEP